MKVINVILVLLLFSIVENSVFGMEIPNHRNDTTLVSDTNYFMSLEELVKVKIRSTSLTEIKDNLNPTPVITITQEDIQLSGARSLDELLEIFVPSFTHMYKKQLGSALGVRGIISDRNNKILLLVNGKVMNIHTDYGVISERFISMLGDIDKIEIIQSPQSSLYGPGAISAVISIFTKLVTEDSSPLEVQINQGVIDNYTNLEISHTKQLKNDKSYSVYYGVDYATGIKNTPHRFAFNGNDGDGDTIVADKNSTYRQNDLNASANNSLRHKAHIQFNSKNFTSWVRYTQGGLEAAQHQQEVVKKKSKKNNQVTINYAHISSFSEYKKEFNKWHVSTQLGYDIESNEFIDINSKRSFQERELYLRALAGYNSKKFSMAIGPAFTYENFGLPGFLNYQEGMNINGTINSENFDINNSDSANAYSESWNTVTMSLISEFQYSILKNLSVHAGLRIDNHSYTSNLISPKAALIWKPSKNYLFRFNYSQSNRKADDVDLRAEYLNTGRKSSKNIEAVDFFELSGDLHIHEKIRFKPSIYYGINDIVAWNGKQLKSETIGNLKHTGFEISSTYITKKSLIRVSYNYVRLLDFELLNGPIETPTNNVSSMPYGYGESFHNYPTHLAKVYLAQKIGKKFTVSSSAQFVGYIQGAEDAGYHNADSLNNNPNNVVFDEGKTTAFSPTVYLNLGLQYNINKKFKANIFAYHLLGLLNENLNKRNEFQRVSHYRLFPTSIGFRLSFRL